MSSERKRREKRFRLSYESALYES